MGDLRLEDKINFFANGNAKCIELYYGDITKLTADEKVDLLMVSAFHGEF